MSEPFEIGRPYKYMEVLEHEYTDHFYTEVLNHYGVDLITELTEQQIDEVQAEADKLEDGYTSFISMCLRNVVNSWENEMYELEHNDDN